MNYLFLVAEDTRRIMAELGFRCLDEMIGRVDCLVAEDAIRHWKTDGLDLTALLHPARKPHPSVETCGARALRSTVWSWRWTIG